eukprot:CAMPEP_0183291994 /NCGR_PEP_ID=MMETSP0160_2-20130417/1226_1 /TAXON_ID=2839 ORGANISM="Odontella Sinensis, Strain Grunow 1884" /NCGR_SAMPLE_ID=MMETSP0160_2 /ASSEMBLY_ACC=CAM_ASM_000250 /LENGTH=132 /DNA_ID=CAMNT_0025452887 /DNA_START=43 /DNA_END=438 /DNA_ORIENTATION=+
MSYYNDEADVDRDEGEEEEGDLPPTVAVLADARVPSNMRGIRACMRCGILKTLDQFLEEGCENCPFLDMENKSTEYTTAFFEGQAAVMDPRQSWVAKWLRVDGYLPGVYAISVVGQFDKETQEELEAGGRRW